MAWLGKVTLGNFSDIAGAVTKLSESVKNIEKNFDSALGFEEKATEAPQSSTEKRTLLDPVFSFVGQKEISSAGNDLVGSNSSRGVTKGSLEHDIKVAGESLADKSDQENYSAAGNEIYLVDDASLNEHNAVNVSTESYQGRGKTFEGGQLPSESLSHDEPVHHSTAKQDIETGDDHAVQEKTIAEREDGSLPTDKEAAHRMHFDPGESSLEYLPASIDSSNIEPEADRLLKVTVTVDKAESKEQNSNHSDITTDVKGLDTEGAGENPICKQQEFSNGMTALQGDSHIQPQVSGQNPLLSAKGSEDAEKLNREVKMLEMALQGAAKQAQVKADEISRLLIENEHLKTIIEDSKKKSSDIELDVLREEYQQRLGAAERKVYALTKERDMLRRELNRKDSSALLKEKDEIIKQVMAEGEELSKKQAAQESQMRKLRAQIRELEEEKQRLNSKLQVEEARVESIRKDKAATEKALQEAVEKSQAELAAQKDFYANALSEAKEAEARAEARADNEAKLELERRLREAGDRETALVQALEELRQALSRTEHQAAFREDMLRRDNEDLERRCQAAESRYEELVARVPESTRPLLRQIEAMQESTAMRAEAWTGVERALNSRLQEAEAKAAAAQEKERAINERLTQTLSRMAVLEAQVSCVKAELAQLNRSLEKERQRASENRQEYLAALESAATQEGRAKQLEEDLRELRVRHKRELAENKAVQELLEQEIEHERNARKELENRLGSDNWTGPEKSAASNLSSQLEHSANRRLRRFSSVSSAGSVEESFFLQASLDFAADQVPPDRVSTSDPVPSPYAGKVIPTATLEQLEAHLRQKEGELASYVSRLAALESTRDSLAEELVKTTTQCEKLRSEVASVPALRTELDALRGRHTSALELMGERDEEVEELRADLEDVKQMYREQIDMLVNQIEKLSAAIGSR